MTDWYPLVAEAVTEGNDGGEKEIVEEGKGQGGGVGEEGHVTSECSTKLTGDVDVDGRTIVVTCSEENLENKDACEITSEKETDANQSTDVEIPKTEAKGN